jgi:hypothetical protein
VGRAAAPPRNARVRIQSDPEGPWSDEVTFDPSVGVSTTAGCLTYTRDVLQGSRTSGWSTKREGRQNPRRRPDTGRRGDPPEACLHRLSAGARLCTAPRASGAMSRGLGRFRRAVRIRMGLYAREIWPWGLPGRSLLKPVLPWAIQCRTGSPHRVRDGWTMHSFLVHFLLLFLVIGPIWMFVIRPPLDRWVASRTAGRRERTRARRAQRNR